MNLLYEHPNGRGLEGGAGLYVPAGVRDEVEAAVDEDAVGGVADALPVGFEGVSPT